MALVVVKIGENEPETYIYYKLLSKHLDIFNLHHKDGNGDVITSLGKKGDKEFLGLNIDMSQLGDQEIKELKWILKQPYYSNSPRLDINGAPVIYKGKIEYQKEARNLWYIDLDVLNVLSEQTKQKINIQTENKRNIKKQLYKYMNDNNLSTGKKLRNKNITQIDDELDRVKQVTKITGNINNIVEYLMHTVNNREIMLNYAKELHLANDKPGYEFPYDLIDGKKKYRIEIGMNELKKNIIDYHKTDEGKLVLIDRITRLHLSDKQNEYAVPFNMSIINDYSRIINFGTFKSSVFNKKTLQSLEEYLNG